MKTTIIAAAIVLLTAPASYADTFGTDPNTTFEIEFVTIGNPGNVADTTGAPNPAGSVPYNYRIGKFEISEGMINKANTLGGLGLTHDNRGANKPATSISWFGIAQFVNWLNTSTGSTPAYNFDPNGNFQLWQSGDAGYNPNNLYRNSLATYFLPSMDEWYKAAYHDPTGSVTGFYWDYTTRSNSVPDGIDSAGDITFDAVFFDGGNNPQPNDITDVGVLSPYGTAGQGGNVWEWEETDFDLVNDSTSSARGVRGGSWFNGSNLLLSSVRNNFLNPSNGGSFVGFRVASIPEPTTSALALAALCLAMSRRRAF
ncbi:MAG: SUMF1/EgtB/PvdO family nonheme iron enzyme [Planctomycetes bacterium]|nr:SUMF1/EgtB/PvdO family nonheme iron enzyme [Planctomycetota bacterium]